MKAQQLIDLLSAEVRKHGDLEVILEVPGDECEVGGVETFTAQATPGNPKLISIMAEGLRRIE